MPLAGYHGGVVGAVFHVRAAEGQPGFFAGLGELFSQAPVRGDSSRESKGIHAVFLRGSYGFYRERVGDRPLERSGEVGLIYFLALLLGVVQYVDHRGLYAGEGEIIALALVERGVQTVRVLIALLGEPFELRPAGIREAQRPRDLVEGLARGVVPRSAYQSEISIAVRADYMAVSAGGDNAHKRRLELGIR